MTESASPSASEILRIILSNEKLKKKIVEALSESFATKGDILTVLNEIKKLREDHNKDVKTILTKLEEMQEAHNRKIERIWDEIKRIREEREKEKQKIWDEIKALREDFNKFGLKLDALGARWGIMNEESFRNALRGILESRLNVKVIKWEDYDKGGLVFHAPSVIEIDVIIKNKEHTLIELKSHISKSDVATFLRKAEFYEKKTGIKPKLIMISPFIDRKAKEFAYQHDVKLYTSSYDEIEI